MNFKKIQEILSMPLEEEAKEYYILLAIAEDDLAGEMLAKMLAGDRNRKKELLSKTNLQLSRAHTLIRDKALYKRLQEFVDEEICKFYKEHKGQIGHCFANMEAPEEKTT